MLRVTQEVAVIDYPAELVVQLRKMALTCWTAVSAKVADVRESFGGVDGGALSPLQDEARLGALRATQRHEALVRVLSSLLGLGLSLGVTYYGIRYLMKAMDPTQHERADAMKRAADLMQKIGVTGVQLTDYELCIASNLVDPLTLVADWADIGGMEDTLRDIQDSLIMPFRHRQLFCASSLIQPPRGVLLYGPPGCGKTMIAKATAKATGARFINLQVSSLFDKWYGESQKRAEAVFSLARKIQPTIIFIDEIDSFLRSRNSQDQETTAMVKTQFMSLWDGLLTDPHCQVMVVGATNRPTDLDAAILRRLPAMFHIKLPSEGERKKILDIILKGENLDALVSTLQLANRTEGLSGSDLRELCRSAAICRVTEYLHNEGNQQDSDGDSVRLRPIMVGDFDSALGKWRHGKLRPGGLSPIDVD